MFCDLIAPSYAKVDTTFAYECGDIGGRKEDEREWEVLDERNVKARVAVELDI